MKVTKQRTKRVSKIKIAKALEIAGDLAPVLAAVSRSRLTAGLSVTIKLAALGAKFYEEFVVPKANPWMYFGDIDNLINWVFVPRVFHNFILERAEGVHVVASGETENTPSAVEAKMGEIRIGWIGHTNNKEKKSVNSMYVWSTDEPALRESFREEVWRSYGAEHLVLTALSFDKEEEFKVEGRFIQTNLIKDTTERVRAFREDGVRSYLLIGLLGTGKTTCIQHIVKELGLRSLRVPLSEVGSVVKPASPGEPSSDFLGLRTIVSVLQPKVVVLDDLDRAPTQIQDQLLDILQDIRRYAEVVLVSANNPGDMNSAIKRVERLDDHIIVPPLGKELVAELLGTERKHAERMADWPIGFINDYLKRVRVLGNAKAEEEIDELERRVREQAEEAKIPRAVKIAQAWQAGIR